MRKKRDLFDEMIEEHRAGKRMLRTHVLKAKPAPRITARKLAEVDRP